MARLLKTPGSVGKPAMLRVADFDGLVRDGATFQLKAPAGELHDGDMLMFNYPDGLGAGINVEEDKDGLCTYIAFEPMFNFQIGLEKVADGQYAFRPQPQHIQIIPALAATGAGVPINRT